MTIPQNSGEASCHRQRYAYDSFGYGNLLWVETRPRSGSPTAVNWEIDEDTNRLSSASYDVAGNMTQSPYQGQLAYDSQDALVRMGPWGENTPRQFVYTADGERVWTILGGGLQVLDVRGFDGQLLRTYTRSMPPNGWSKPWSWSGDVVWRGSQRLAQVGGAGARHYHPDHLGTPRLQTNGAGAVSKRLDVFPFGREAPGTDSASVRFTGHERDNLGTTSGVDDMDYMHARFYSPQFGRFFQVDPSGASFNLKNPQSWNRYTYVRNSPLNYVDPDGEVLDTVADVGFIVYDLFDIGRTLARGEDVSGTQLAALGADVGAAFVPFATGAGSGVRALTKADRAVSAARLARNVATGRRGEQLAMKAGLITAERKGIKSLSETASLRFPDGLTRTTITEVKFGRGPIRLTNQLKDFLAFAQKTKRRFVLVVPEGAPLHKRLQKLVDDGKVELVELTAK